MSKILMTLYICLILISSVGFLLLIFPNNLIIVIDGESKEIKSYNANDYIKQDCLEYIGKQKRMQIKYPSQERTSVTTNISLYKEVC